MFRRKKVDPEYQRRVMQLAAYNGRVSQGIVHTPEYVERMRREQEWFDGGYDHQSPWPEPRGNTIR